MAAPVSSHQLHLKESKLNLILLLQYISIIKSIRCLKNTTPTAKLCAIIGAEVELINIL